MMMNNPTSTQTRDEFLLNFVLLGTVLLLTFAAFSPTLKNDFITNDDPGHLLNNDLVRSLSLANINRIFEQAPNETYIPLTILSFAVEYHFFGYHPFGYHLNNLILHLIIVALIYMIAIRWFAFAPWAAGLTALLFGIHPMHVESVAWITERKDVLYSVFYLLAVDRYCAYLKGQKRGSYYWTLIFSSLSILAKPMALSLPLIFFLLDWYFRRKTDIYSILEKLPHVLIIAPVAAVTYVLNARVVGTTVWETTLTWLWCLMFYPQKFFFPDVLLTVYSLPEPVSLARWEYLKAVLCFVGAVGCMIKFRNCRILIFAVGYYFVSIFFLLRFDNFTDVNFVADRFMYLPSLGVCLALGALGEKSFLRAGNVFWRRCFIVVIVGVSIFLGGKTFNQTQLWGNGVRLWSGVIEHYPDLFYAYDHRGYAYAQQKKFRMAIADYDNALRLKSRYMPAYHNRALAYSNLGEDEKALWDFDTVFKLKPDYAKGYFNRGVFYAQRGIADKAIADYTRAIQISGGLFVESFSNRGVVFLSEKRIAEAILDFNRAIDLDSRDVFARNNRAIAKVLSKDHQGALKDLTEAIKIAPRDAETYFNRGLVYFILEKPVLALADFKKALQLNPRHDAAMQKAMDIQKTIGH